MYKKYGKKYFDSNQDLSPARRRLYEQASRLIEQKNGGKNHHDSKIKKKKMTIDEYIERVDMQQKWIDHYKIHRRY